jgi:hypothetical protein
MMIMGLELNTGVWPARVRPEELPPAACRATKKMLEDVEIGGNGSTPVALAVGNQVRVQDADPLGNQRWNRRGEIIKRFLQWLYVVLGDDGFQKRRNVRFHRLELDSRVNGEANEEDLAPVADNPVPQTVGRPKGSKAGTAPAGFVPRRSPCGDWMP